MAQKILCIYYSRSGHTKDVIDRIKDKITCDVERITEPRRRKGLFGFMRSGYESFTKKIITIDDLTHNPSEYDLVVIATPLWAGGISSPVRSYLYKYKELLKSKVAYIVTSGSKSPDKVFLQLEELTGIKPVNQLECKHRDFKKKIVDSKIDQFLETLEIK